MSAILDVSSTEGGFLVPRMTLVQKSNISNPTEGLLIYQVDGTKGFWYFDGSAWVYLPNNRAVYNNADVRRIQTQIYNNK